ncbi:Alternative oxidase, mitochondrial [Psilocybe cubensis]|uniref:Alternative oxidase n=2 Tax=Psilocybe cubensis TaxID=181762 RepID=A0A8H8CM88_PSICU|nr:Alternative oxidase, mitochondrial [Psilocybe cubensis]KAH9480475.1 Alternative oxidase, mitochondrial [Psilocybe cubensis]
MIRTTLIKSTASPALRLGLSSSPLRSRSVLALTLGSHTHVSRQLSTSSMRPNESILTTKQSHNESTEGHNLKHEVREVPLKEGTGSRLTQHDAVSTVPVMVRGDWVLFHPVYSPEELKAVEVLHRNPKTLGDKFAAGLVKLSRRIFDFVSGYKHNTNPPAPGMTLEELRKAGYMLSEKQWLERILFLESIAGVPGMVAATLRHLTSLRLMRRDSGWIHTCLEEAENERMHLMTFMTLRQPSIFFRLMILGAQGVFYNLFFLSYLISPKICHRFVGYLEEEAVVTYTRCIADLEAGKIPEWTNLPAPEISIDYWRLHPDAKLLDVLYAVRSDETTHRFVNHSLANLNPATDVNPFALREPDMHVKGAKIEQVILIWP